MQQKYLVVVDLQNDFVTGSLGTPEARAIVPRAVERAATFEGCVLLTRDTHYADYLSTQEGRHLPVVHCVEGTEGWQFVPELQALRRERGWKVYDKETFASVNLARDLGDLAAGGNVASIEFVGLCTDICVVSNALLVKSFAPQVPVFVCPDACAGTTPDRHVASLETMQSCQILLRCP